MKELFLTLDNAVATIIDRLNLVEKEDEEWLRNELMQKCYVSSDQYTIGYEKAKQDIISIIKAKE